MIEYGITELMKSNENILTKLSTQRLHICTWETISGEFLNVNGSFVISHQSTAHPSLTFQQKQGHCDPALSS